MAVAGMALFLSWLMFGSFRYWLTTLAFFLFGILGCWENLRFGFFNRRCMRMNADERGCVERDVEWMRK
jgi:hypothetical protein